VVGSTVHVHFAHWVIWPCDGVISFTVRYVMAYTEWPKISENTALYDSVIKLKAYFGYLYC